ncbi:hypothetical protein JCM17846_27930 [Iodidimonas nitroreducens]|uniref:Uncharacterized protein n=1 Tax=Iodidimonas nitroreducens TaxID=1236968 RepID=A0A5A7N9R7_9PROT|nr:hypothetical protein JCM17846_27930 [Iodidimonas nitroreducens]
MIVLLALFYALAPFFLTMGLERLLKNAGFAQPQVHDLSIKAGWTVAIGRLSLGAEKDLVLHQITAQSSPRALIKGRLQSLEIGSLSARIMVDQAALLEGQTVRILSCAGVVFPQNRESAGLSLPFDRLQLNRADFVFKNAGKEAPLQGPLIMGLDRLRIALDDDPANENGNEPQTKISSAISLRHDFGQMTGTVEAALSKAGAPLYARLLLQEGALIWPQMAKASPEQSPEARLEAKIEGTLEADWQTGALMADLRARAPDHSLHLKARADLVSLASTGRIEAESRDPGALYPAISSRTETRLGADYALEWAAGGPLLTLDPLEIHLGSLVISDMALIEGRMAPGQFKGTARIDARAGLSVKDRPSLFVEGAVQSGFSGRIANADIMGLDVAMPAFSLEASPQKISIAPNQCVDISLDSLEVVDFMASGLPSLCLHAAEPNTPSDQPSPPFLAYDLATKRIDLAMAIRSIPFAIAIKDGTQSWPLSGQSPQVLVHAHSLPDAGITAKIKAEGGRLNWPDPALIFADIASGIEMEKGQIQSLNFEIGTLKSATDPQMLAPLRIEGQSVWDMAGIDFKAWASDPMGVFVLEMDGRAEKRGDGQATLLLYPVTFMPDIAEPGDLLPLLGDRLQNFVGTLGFDGALSWAAPVTAKGVDASDPFLSRLQMGGLLTLDEIGFERDALSLSGLSSQIRIDRIWPLKTAADQSLAIKSLNAGFPLLNGHAVFDLSDADRLSVDAARFDLAGGSIRVEPFIVDLTAIEDTHLVLLVEDAKLAQIFQAGGVDGLTGDGLLTGRLPLQYKDGTVQITDGFLKASENGVMHYAPNDLPDFLRGDDLRSQMLRQALRNFHYDHLNLGINGDLAGQQSLNLEARGANPDFLDGHPIELNFNLQGALMSAIDSAMGAGRASNLENLYRQSQMPPPPMPLDDVQKNPQKSGPQ